MKTKEKRKHQTTLTFPDLIQYGLIPVYIWRLHHTTHQQLSGNFQDTNKFKILHCSSLTPQSCYLNQQHS